MSQSSQGNTEKVVSFPNSADDLDRAGHAVFGMVHKASKIAVENTQRAMDIARNLSHQLQAAEDRIAILEAENRRNAERADRAEQWLLRIYTEIENNFSSLVEGIATQSPSGVDPLSKYAPKRNRS